MVLCILKGYFTLTLVFSFKNSPIVLASLDQVQLLLGITIFVFAFKVQFTRLSTKKN